MVRQVTKKQGTYSGKQNCLALSGVEPLTFEKEQSGPLDNWLKNAELILRTGKSTKFPKVKKTIKKKQAEKSFFKLLTLLSIPSEHQTLDNWKLIWSNWSPLWGNAQSRYSNQLKWMDIFFKDEHLANRASPLCIHAFISQINLRGINDNDFFNKTPFFTPWEEVSDHWTIKSLLMEISCREHTNKTNDLTLKYWEDLNDYLYEQMRKCLECENKTELDSYWLIWYQQEKSWLHPEMAKITSEQLLPIQRPYSNKDKKAALITMKSYWANKMIGTIWNESNFKNQLSTGLKFLSCHDATPEDNRMMKVLSTLIDVHPNLKVIFEETLLRHSMSKNHKTSSKTRI